MAFQSTKITINKKKNIGKVIYIVEGEKKEFNLLNKIFKDILDYSVVNIKRNGSFAEYQSQFNEHSQVFVINSESSNIDSVTTGKDYLDKIYESLVENYNLDPSNAAIYYIFDRDAKSNKESKVKELINILRNSRDNEFESNGVLLLSYPSIESFVVSCFKKKAHRIKLNSQEIKKYLGDNNIQQNNINEEVLKKGTKELFSAIYTIAKRIMKESDLDDLKDINERIYNNQEKSRDDKNKYRLISLFLISLWDLGLVTFKWKIGG